MERLQKFMAACGVASRRKCEELIVDGRVTVNGQVIQELGYQIDPINDKVKVNGKTIATEDKVYILLNKPIGYVTTASDPQNRKIVLDLLKGVTHRVYPVGRLDIDTSGLLLLTNDGELAHKMTHPKFELDKVYVAQVKGIPSKQALQKLQEGIMLEDGMTAPAQVKLMQMEDEVATIEIIIHEGRNRQVRRMFETIGHPVKKLHRKRVGFLTLKNLKSGTFRHLEPNEIMQLKRILSN